MWYSLSPDLSESAAVYLLAGGVALQALASTWGGAAMSAQLVECTPEHQRGIAGSWVGIWGRECSSARAPARARAHAHLPMLISTAMRKLAAGRWCACAAR